MNLDITPSIEKQKRIKRLSRRKTIIRIIKGIFVVTQYFLGFIHNHNVRLVNYLDRKVKGIEATLKEEGSA